MTDRHQETVAFQAVVDRLKNLGWYHSLSLPDGTVIPALQSEEHLQARLNQFDIAADLSGKRVLDIGAWDGWFTFECERRGAFVTAIDANPGTNFEVAHKLKQSSADYRILSVLDLDPETVGTFDIVLFLGVLYHLKHPLLALEKVCAVSTDRVLVKSFVIDDTPDDPTPRMEFYESTQLCGQLDNWNGPNVACLLAWCRTAGFARVVLHSVVSNRAHVTCYRKWPAPALTNPAAAAPYLLLVENATLSNHSFSTKRDDYVSVWFEFPATELSLDEVFPEVHSFGIRPVAVVFSGGAWLVNLKLPFGLAQGWYEVSLRVKESAPSNSIRIAVDNPPQPQSSHPQTDLLIQAACDNSTWEPNRIRLHSKSCIALWVAGLDDVTVPDRGDVQLRLRGTSIPCCYLSAAGTDGQRQLNALLPSGLPKGPARLELEYRSKSTSIEVELV